MKKFFTPKRDLIKALRSTDLSLTERWKRYRSKKEIYDGVVCRLCTDFGCKTCPIKQFSDNDCFHLESPYHIWQLNPTQENRREMIQFLELVKKWLISQLISH